MTPESAPLSHEKPRDSQPAAPSPEQGGDSRWRHLAAALRFDGLWWRKFARLGCVYGPEWWKRYSPPFFAAAIFLLVKRNRSGAIENQAHVLGPGSPQWRAVAAGFRTFAAFAHCMTETMEYYGPHPRWDISGRALHATGRPIHMVMAREPNETTQEYARRSREQVGVQVIFSDSSVFSAFNMIRALRDNEILAIQLDRGNGEPNSPARQVEFFGAKATFQEGPFHLARLSGAPVVPVVTIRRGVRHYEIVLGEPLYVSRSVAGDSERALGEAVRFFERMIREHPEQWFQFSPFWTS